MMAKIFGAMSTRIFLIVIAGVILTATIVNVLSERASRTHESRMHGHFVYERVENTIRILDATVPNMRGEIQQTLSHMGSRVTLNVPAPETVPALPAEFKELSEQLVPDIADKVTLIHGEICQLHRPPLQPRNGHPPIMHHKPVGQENSPPPPDFEPPPEMDNPQCLAVYTHLADGTPLLIHLHYGRPPPMPKHGQEPFNLVLTILGLILMTWLVANLATKPLRRLAQAALQLAKDIERPPLAENEGPIEVRKAASAFNEMQRSILKHLQERAFILGAIAHDLQTPLTRLRLRLEKVKDPLLQEQLIKDLSATLEMVREGLDFARLCSENIDKSKVNFTDLVTSICDDFSESGQTIAFNLPRDPIYIMGSKNLLQRCLTNLINNALTYAKNPAIGIQIKEKKLLCTVTDDGAGVPDTELETILEPFRRLDDSRSRYTGGTGLGLSIARMIVEKHDGKIYLLNKTPPLTGLIVSIELPL